MDDGVDTHLLLRIAQQPLHKATATRLATQALMLWKALRSVSPYVKLHIVKQESHRYQYGNGKVDIQAVHQRTTRHPALVMPDLDRHHTHFHLLPAKAEPHLTPDQVPEDAPYTSDDRAYHYSNPIQPVARVLGDVESRAHIRGTPGDTESPPIPLSTPSSMWPSPLADATHAAPQNAVVPPQ